MKQTIHTPEPHPVGLPKIKHKKNSNLTHILVEATEGINRNRSSSYNDSKEVLQQTFYRKHKQKLSKLIEK